MVACDSVDPSLRPCPVEGFDLELQGDEGVIYHPVSQAIFYCNVTAALIFRLCDGARSLAEITAMLCKAYPEAGERLAREVEETVDKLAQHGALTLS